MSALPNHEDLVERIQRDLLDSYDEELELEDHDASGDDPMASGRPPVRAA